MMAAATKQKIMTALFCAATLFYLSFHILHGEQGLYALLVQSHKQEKLKAELAQLRAQRMALEHKVKLLSDASIDPDLLEEESRRYLGYASKDEWVVITK